jgi:hypothetical protein
MKCVINQPAGLGDIFFCQKIAETLIHNDYEVYWPVKPSIDWVGNYLVNTKKVHYVNQNEFITPEDSIIITLDGAQHMTGGLIMKSKYQIVNIEWDDWLKYFNFQRNIKKENELYYDILGLRDGEHYTFINKYYGTPPDYAIYDVEENPNEKNINLEIIENFSIFDWIKVIENAKQIRIIDTSLNYIIEKLNVKAENMICYCRLGQSTFNEISYLFNKNWEYKWN